MFCRWNALSAVSLVFLCMGMWCGLSRAASPAVSGEGRALYEYYCYQCHGYSGDAATLASQYLQPRPRNFTRSSTRDLSRSTMIHTVRNGKPGTGMVAFARVLDARQTAAVVDYIRATFMRGVKPTTAYHTAANGWPRHERYVAAFPFATGQLRIDARDLTVDQESGKHLFLSSCASCHEPRGNDGAAPWAARVVSFPRNAQTCTPCHKADFVAAAPGDSLHSSLADERRSGSAPSSSEISLSSQRQGQGAQLFKDNCAFCHAEDGSGRNWIGTFMEPHARDLTQSELKARGRMDQLRQTIRNGLPGTSMPAWKQVLTDGQIDSLLDYLDARHGWARTQAEPGAVPAGGSSVSWSRKR